MCLAIPGKIVSLADDPAHSALIDVVGVRRRVDVSLVEPDGIGPGDWVLIHVGFAMSKIREAGRLRPTAHAHRPRRDRGRHGGGAGLQRRRRRARSQRSGSFP